MLGDDINIGDLIRSRWLTTTFLVISKIKIQVPYKEKTLYFLELGLLDLGTNQKIKMHLSPERNYDFLCLIQPG